jgi:hypothetical protein
MLKYVFPTTGRGASEHGGGMINTNIFFKLFDIKDEDFGKTLAEINVFLETNGYFSIELSEIDDDYSFEKDDVSISLNPYEENGQIILTINRGLASYSESEYLIYQLKKFGVSLNTNVLALEDIEFEKKRLAKELAQIYLLVDSLKLKIEEIVLDEIENFA